MHSLWQVLDHLDITLVYVAVGKTQGFEAAQGLQHRSESLTTF